MIDFGRTPVDRTFIRSNETPGEDTDIVYHKNKMTVLTYLSMGLTPRTVCELGVKEGGSLVLWDLMYRPMGILGIDINVKQLSEAAILYLMSHPNIVAINADCRHPGGIRIDIEQLFIGGVDLIIDDVHAIETTPICLTELWPLVTEGGSYVIEDWKTFHPIHREELHEVVYSLVPSQDITYHENLIHIRKVARA